MKRLAFIAAAYLVGTSASAQEEDSNCTLYDKDEMVSGLMHMMCVCAEIEDDDKKRLSCYDFAALRLSLIGTHNRFTTEMLRRTPGGYEAMRRAVERGPFSPKN